MKKKPNIPTEHDEQVRIVQWCKYNIGKYPSLEMLYAVPSAGKRTFAMMNYYKAEGFRGGVPDLSLPVPSQKHHGLYIELKRVKGGKVSPEQEWWLERLTEQGYYAVICKGADEAIQTIIDYLEGKL
jgi:hypothetical protein